MSGTLTSSSGWSHIFLAL